MDKANRGMLLPALADGQSALVIDRKLASKHFVESLPATEKPMPMVEPAPCHRPERRGAVPEHGGRI